MTKRTYTCEQLADAVESASSIADVLRCIDLAPRGGNYDTVKRALVDCGIDSTHLRSLARIRRGLEWDFSVGEIRDAAAVSRSLAELMRRLGRSPTSAGYSHIRRVLIEGSIDTSHFIGQGWRRGVPGRLRPRTP